MKFDLKILKPKKKFKKGGIHINPNVYWEISLAMVFFVMLVLVIFGFFLFKKVNNELSLTSDMNTKIETIDKARIDKALEYFNKRAENSKEIINSPSPIVDPSR